MTCAGIINSFNLVNGWPIAGAALMTDKIKPSKILMQQVDLLVVEVEEGKSSSQHYKFDNEVDLCQ